MMDEAVHLAGTRPYVVGIGASAGGLEALAQLVGGLLPDLGCIYVVAQHVSPNHRSMLADILSRDTSLEVREAADKERPAPNTIYIVPPGHNLVIRGGCFHITTSPPEVSPKPSINLMLQSLAEEFDEHSVGVILSGTGSDGTAGLRAIKAAGGMTFAQMPETAKYDGMPRSAVDAGIVDRVVAPEEIGGELHRLIHLPASADDGFAWDQPPADIGKLFGAVRQRTRIDFSSYKLSTVLRRLHRRIVATGCNDFESYLAYTEKNPSELEALARETLISVTEFFRDKEAFRALERHVREIVSRRLPGDEIRAWVAGCATGEEAYSLAILFSEYLGGIPDKGALQIFATDIDNDALGVARRGVYNAAAMAEIPHDYLSRYFQPCPGGYEPVKPLRECVVFARQDITADPPFLRLDLITCRNVLIYFNTELQARVLSILHYALKPNGVLFLGRSENVSQQESLFMPIDRRSRLFRVRPDSRTTSAPGKVVRGRLPGMSLGQRPVESGYEKLFLGAVAEQFAPAAVLVDGNFRILHTYGSLAQFIQLPQGTPDMNLALLITPELKQEAVTTLHRARRSGKVQRSRRRRVLALEGQPWTMLVRPLGVYRDVELFLVIFEPAARTDQEAESEVLASASTSESQTEAELHATQEHLQTLLEEMAASNEELQALNEEVQAANEELQATNEELEATNEELQATNEELISVNEESLVKSAELAAINADFESVYNTLDFPVLVFDSMLCVKRVNLSAIRLYNLPLITLGQPVAQLRLPAFLDGIETHMESVLNEQRKDAFTVNYGGRTYQVHVTPAANAAGLPQGVVLVVIDHTDLALAQSRIREAHDQLMAIMNHSVSLVTLKDTSGRYQFVNQRFAEIFDLHPEDLIGRTDRQIFDAETASLLRGRELDAMGSMGSIESTDELCFRGRRIFLQTVRFPIFDAEGVVQAICTQANDVTHRRHAEEQLRLAAKVFDRAGEAIAVTDARGSIVTVNNAFTLITGYGLDEVIGKTPAILKSGEHSNDFYSELWRALVEKGWWQGEIFNRRKDGEVYPEWLTINSVQGNDGQVLNYVAIFSDISAIKSSQRRIEYMATHDELTGLPNRSLLMDRLKHGLAQAKRQKKSLALLFIDLDNFKNINDSLGHDIGDLLLKEAAARLQRCVRDSDTLARLGGDEFVAVLGDVDLEEINRVASRIVDFLSASFRIGDKDLFVSASIGISCFPEDGEDSVTLLKNADTAMYRAKERGRKQYQFFADEMKVLALQRLTLETGLRLAIDHDHFHLVFQPQIDLAGGALSGAEALLRWKDPTLGDVSPARFIPVAEGGGLMNTIGRMVLAKAIDQIAEWRAGGLSVPRISINVSAIQLRDPEFGAVVREELARCDVPPEAIAIELTESALMERLDVVAGMLVSLEEIGVGLSIDDFGTGYSSLAYLKRLPIHEIKIDRSFVDGIAEESDDRAIATAIVQMARALGMQVVAEGVENEAQLAVLKTVGCDLAQGYHFHRPLPPAEFARLLGTA